MLTGYLYTIGIVSIITLVLFSYDKVASTDDKRFRIPIYTLIMLIGLGGAIVAGLAMPLYRHKTQKDYFIMPIIVCGAIQIFTLISLLLH